jgi:hypothetical protein
MFPSPPRGGEGGSSDDPFGRSKFSATPNRTPRHLTSPSLGSESGPVVQDGTAVLPAYPSLAPRGSTPPSNGRGLGAGRPVGTGSTALPHTPHQNATGNGSNSPSWADVVRNGHRLSSSPPKATSASSASTADFLALYERCISSGFKTRINMSSSVEVHEVILTCYFPTAITSARSRRRRRRPRRRGLPVHAAAPTRTSLPRTLSSPPPSRPELPPPVLPAPEPSPPDTLPTPSPPPAKRTRKAVKRRCEIELLRGVEMEDDVCVSPPLHTPPPARSPPPPSPTPTTSPFTEQSLSLDDHDLPQSPAILPALTPDRSATAPAPSTISTTPTSPGPPSPPPSPAPGTSTLTSPAPAPSSAPSTAPTTSEPPPPPPWPEGYVFSTDPDRIICRFCCKRHYNYKWYSHCYLCHSNEKKS